MLDEHTDDRYPDEPDHEYDETRRRRRPPWYRRPGPLATLGAAVVVAALVVSFLVKGLVSWPNERVAREEALTGSYTQLEQRDSAFERQITARYQLAGEKAKKIVEVVHAAAANANATGRQIDSRGFAVVLQQVLPDLGSLQIYDELSRDIATGQESYYRQVSRVIDEAAGYSTWIGQVPQSWFVGNPTGHLRADGLSGVAALNHIQNPPMDDRTRAAFNSGKFGDILPTTTPSG